MEGSVCKLNIAMIDGSWEKSVALDIYGSKYAPSVRIDRPSVMEDDAEVSATVSCQAPWDIDDNPEDDSMTVFAGKLPLVTYESGDIYWTGGIALLMLILAYFGGVLNINNDPKDKSKWDAEPPSSESVTPTKKEEVPEIKIRTDDISLDDISLDDDSPEEIAESQPEPEIELEIKPEEEVIDIDDSTASGRLSVLRNEMATDSDGKTVSKDDISSRLDSFLKDR